MRDPLPSYVFQVVTADLFQAGKLHVLVYADRLSGWAVVHQWNHSPSAKETVRAVISSFIELGVPVMLRSDGGPQFKAKEFTDALYRWGVEWRPSSPHYPRSNGHAEAAVKAVKSLVIKCAPSGDLNSEVFLQGLLELRNTPDATGLSPAEVVFGHQLRSIVPAHRSSFQPRWTTAMEARNRQVEIDSKTRVYHDESALPLKPIRIGESVRIQNPVSHLWDRVGTVVSVGRYRDYRIKLGGGAVMWRNRRFLRILHPSPGATGPSIPASMADPNADPNAVPERAQSSSHTGSTENRGNPTRRQGTRKRQPRKRLIET